MASITSATATPANVNKGGGTSKIAVTVSNPDATGNVTLEVDGKTLTVALTVHEPVQFSIASTDVGKPGVLTAQLDGTLGGLGSLSVGSDGQSFVFTAT